MRTIGPMLILVAALLTTTCMGASDCPAMCACRWKSGKETVECLHRNFDTIPEGISSGTQVLDMTGNSLLVLPPEVFRKAGLLNLQRIYLAQCRINQISESAFARLTNLVELDLSHNLLQAIPSKTFKDYTALRRLALSGNPITRIESNAFVNLPVLNVLEMSRCRIAVIAPKAFEGLDSLTHLKLDGNLLTSLRAGTVIGLRGLHDAELHGNPWRCDCFLRDMRTWLVKNKVPYTVSPVCDQPKRLYGLAIDQLNTDELACEPRGEPYRVAKSTIGEDATLVCRTKGVPEPTIQWTKGGKSILNMSMTSSSDQMFLIHENGTTDKVSVLTITSIEDSDAGEYACIAENRAGQMVTNFTLQIVPKKNSSGALGGVQVTGLVMGMLIIGVAFGCVILVLRRRRKKRQQLATSKNKPVPSLNHVDFTADNVGNSKLIKKPLLSHCNPAVDKDLTPYARNFIENNLGGSCIGHTSGLNSKPDVVNVDEGTGESIRVREKRWSECNDSNPNDGAVTLAVVTDPDSNTQETRLHHEVVVRPEHERRTENRPPRRALLRTSTSSDWGGSTQGLLAGSPQSSLDESSSSGSSRAACVRVGDGTLCRSGDAYRFRNSVPVLPPMGQLEKFKDQDPRRRFDLGRSDL